MVWVEWVPNIRYIYNPQCIDTLDLAIVQAVLLPLCLIAAAVLVRLLILFAPCCGTPACLFCRPPILRFRIIVPSQLSTVTFYSIIAR